MRYSAFLSYSHADARWARWLHRALESYRLPRELASYRGRTLPRRLPPVFRDRDELASSANLSAVVSEALRQSESLIVICSPRAARSPWVNEEIQRFRQMGRSERIFCFIVSGEPGIGDENQCFPPALLTPDEVTGACLEPVAADARREGDGRRNALLKLVAGMLDIGLDSLKHREQRRYQRRLWAVSGTSLFIAAATITLAITANIARQEANLRRSQAEDLIDFMLGDLQEQLWEIGRLDIFESVGNEAQHYFTRLKDEDVSNETLSQRARNLRQIGNVRLELGHLAPALEVFQESLQITRKLAQRDPEHAALQIGLANSYFYVGHVHWLRGELPQARAQFEAVLPIIDAVTARDPTNPDWLAEQSYAYTNLGRVLELEGEFQRALGIYSRVMRTNQQLVELDPSNPDYELELGFAHNNLGKLVALMGRLDEAELHFRRDLEIKTRIVAATPDHNTWLSYLGPSQYFLAQLLASRGEFTEAESLLLAAEQIFRKLLEFDSHNRSWTVRLARIERELGSLFARSGRVSRAKGYLDSSVHAFQQLVQSDARNAAWRYDLVRSLLLSSDIDYRNGEATSAAEHLQTAEVHLELLVGQEPSSRDTRKLGVYAGLCAAQLAANQPIVAKAVAQETLLHIEEYFPSTSDPGILDLQLRALNYLGRLQEAGVIDARLRTMGYIPQWTRRKDDG